VKKTQKIYIDENIPPHFAEVLNILQKSQNIKEKTEIEIFSIKETFGQGTTDEKWISEIGKEQGIVITKDYNIHKNKAQRDLYQSKGIGIFVLKSLTKKKELNYWEIIQLIINKWDEIKQKINETDFPFIYKVTPRKKIERL